MYCNQSSISSSPRKRITMLATAVALTFAAGSAAAVELFGGGATFPSQGYVGNDYNLTTPDRSRLSSNATNVPITAGWQWAGLTTGSAFADYSADSGHLISYCQTGSGIGKQILIGVGPGTNPVVNANGACSDFGPTAPTPVQRGFSGLRIIPDYTGTDSPINQADYTSFLGGPRVATRVGIVQVPSLAGSIALPNHAASLADLDLTTEQVCRIFSARITNWSGIPGSGSSSSIRVVYRSDTSGTTFAYTSWLASQCNNRFGIPAGYFTPNQSYVAAVPAAAGVPPVYAASSGQSGNGNVVANVIANANSVGYADYPEVDAQGAEFALVNGRDPGNLPARVSLPASSLLTRRVLNANNVPVVLSDPPSVTVGNCLRLINPSAVPSGVTYPILAYTYLNAYYDGNAGRAAAIRRLLNYFYSPNGRAAQPAGFAYIDGNATFRASAQATINNCVNS